MPISAPKSIGQLPGRDARLGELVAPRGSARRACRASLKSSKVGTSATRVQLRRRPGPARRRPARAGAEAARRTARRGASCWPGPEPCADRRRRWAPVARRYRSDPEPLSPPSTTVELPSCVVGWDGECVAVGARGCVGAGAVVAAGAVAAGVGVAAGVAAAASLASSRLAPAATAWRPRGFGLRLRGRSRRATAGDDDRQRQRRGGDADGCGAARRRATAGRCAPAAGALTCLASTAPAVTIAAAAKPAAAFEATVPRPADSSPPAPAPPAARRAAAAAPPASAAPPAAELPPAVDAPAPAPRPSFAAEELLHDHERRRAGRRRRAPCSRWRSSPWKTRQRSQVLRWRRTGAELLREALGHLRRARAAPRRR